MSTKPDPAGPVAGDPAPDFALPRDGGGTTFEVELPG